MLASVSSYKQCHEQKSKQGFFSMTINLENLMKIFNYEFRTNVNVLSGG